jgi:formylglycine-generating enzyme required for sulfatase activity
LFDMVGNVSEWCQDEALEDDGDDIKKGGRFFRGGHFWAMTRITRAAKRFAYLPETRLSMLGFRVARTLPDHVVGERPGQRLESNPRK